MSNVSRLAQGEGGWRAGGYWQSKHTGLRAHGLLCVHRGLGQAPRSRTSWRQRQQCHHLVTVNSVSALKSLAQYLQSPRSHISSVIMTWMHRLPGRAECPGLPSGLHGPLSGRTWPERECVGPQKTWLLSLLLSPQPRESGIRRGVRTWQPAGSHA